jgi:alpha-tubulin suppressor-like RCC1 family protein
MCILMSNMTVRCWGRGDFGELGYGNTENIGDDEFPTDITDVVLGGPALEIDAGGSYTCARLANGKLRCWGNGFDGQLGYGSTFNVGDDELPDSAGDVPLGTAASGVATGYFHTCAITANASIRCWGMNSWGQLGLGNINPIGDDEPASSVGDVSAIPIGLPNTTKVAELALSHTTTCALYDTGDVMCWGSNDHGELGQGHTKRIGDDELPSMMTAIPLLAPAVQITTGDTHACALLDTDEVVCWGPNDFGQLGLGHTQTIGDDETPDSIAPIDLGGAVTQIDAGGEHTCALLAETNEVYCWGANYNGELGYGNVNTIGDDEQPVDAGTVPLF